MHSLRAALQALGTLCPLRHFFILVPHVHHRIVPNSSVTLPVVNVTQPYLTWRDLRNEVQ